MKKYNNWNTSFGLLWLACFFGLVINVFNDDPIASVLACGFLGVISAMHVLFERKSK